MEASAPRSRGDALDEVAGEDDRHRERLDLVPRRDAEGGACAAHGPPQVCRGLSGWRERRSERRDSPGSVSSLTTTTRPSASTISTSTRLSMLRPCRRLRKPKPDSMRMEDPVGCAALAK